MLVTTILTFFVVRYRWKYNLALTMLGTGFFLVIDLAFFSANTIKILHGGWFPLFIGSNVDCVCDHKQADEAVEDPWRIMLANIGRKPITGNSSNAGADNLDAHMRGKVKNAVHSIE
jgi:hypothetical protein